MYNCPTQWYTVVHEMSVDEMSVDELSWNRTAVSNCPPKFKPLNDGKKLNQVLVDC